MPHHVVVDGSNLATEGRTQPSLKQLNEAVLAYMAEDPEALITVVVDATFGHRIDSTEVAEFDEAVSNNELVAPPAGAIGRGDAFVLSIANKVRANILTNDSYQEFHAQYDWLFDEGRLIGGKPVPHIGWVFVNRLPVRGPLSRKVTGEAKRKGSGEGVGRGRGRGRAALDEGSVRVGSVEASKPMPVPKSPPPRAAAKAPVADAAPAATEPKGRRRVGRGETGRSETAGSETGRSPGRSPGRSSTSNQGGSVVANTVEPQSPTSTVNDLLAFLTFVERHAPGTSVNAVVDHYSSHGAYVRIGDVVGYVPLRLMAAPAPRSAREFMKVGESVTLVVESFVPSKRSVDLAIPGMGTALPLGEAAPLKPAKRTAKRTDKVAAEPAIAASIDMPAASRRTRAAKSLTPIAPKAVALASSLSSSPARAKKVPPSKSTGSAASAAPSASAKARAPKPVAKKADAEQPAKKLSAAATGKKRAAGQRTPSAAVEVAEPAPTRPAPTRPAPTKPAGAKKAPRKSATAAVTEPAESPPPTLRRGRSKA